jgi:hypothetical protein
VYSPRNKFCRTSKDPGNRSKHYDERLTITGKVAQVTIRPKVVFLDLNEPFPNSPFTGVIFSFDTNKFKDPPKLKGENVEITAKIKNSQDKPEIGLTNASQLKVVGDKK